MEYFLKFPNNGKTLEIYFFNCSPMAWKFTRRGKDLSR